MMRTMSHGSDPSLRPPRPAPVAADGGVGGEPGERLGGEPSRRRGLARPVVGAEYEQLLRTDRHRWWRPLVSLLLVLALAVLFLLGLFTPGLYLAGALLGGPAGSFATVERWLSEDASLSATILLNVLLALLIPVALLAVRWGHRVPGRTLHSVTGRVRWGWLARCSLLLLPVWVAFLAVAFVLEPTPGGSRAPDWGWFVVVAVVLTPFQAAGEEYLFRGWFLQSIGSWFAHRGLALAVPTVLSIVAFGAGHGTRDPWLLADLAITTVAAVVLTWRTGGLEAAVALHTVNNVLVSIVVAFLAIPGGGLIDETTRGAPPSTLLTLAVHAGAVAILLRAARRHGIARTAPEPFGTPREATGSVPTAR